MIRLTQFLIAFVLTVLVSKNSVLASNGDKGSHAIRAGSLTIGLDIGRTFVHLDDYQELHNRFGATLQYSLSHHVQLKSALRFHEANGILSVRLFEYRGSTLITRNIYRLSSLGLNLGLVFPTYRFVSGGLGLSLEYERIKTTTNDRLYPFYIDVLKDTLVPFGAEESQTDFFSPGLFLETELHLPLAGSFQVYLNPEIKLMYIGDHSYSDPMDSWISLTVFGGFKTGIR